MKGETLQCLRLFEVALKYYYIKMLSACFKAKNLHCVVEQARCET